MSSISSDLRYGVRMLARTPGLSIIAVLTIGIGVGLTTHTFSVVYGTLLRGLDVRDADRLVTVWENDPENDVTRMNVPIHDFEAFREQQTTLESMAALYQGTVNVAGVDGPPLRFNGAFTTWNALEILGVPPHLGRTFRPGEDQPGAPRTVVLGYDAWRNQFGADEGVIGGSVRVNGRPGTIIGVMPPGFEFPFQEEIWITNQTDPAEVPRREGTFLNVYGYLREGTTLEAASDELATLAARLEDEYPEANEGIGAHVEMWSESTMPPEIVATMWAMLGAVFGVLLIACANVANLLLARATVRQREVAIRTALGAERWLVVRQLLSETLVLSLAGGVVGLVGAWIGVRLFNNAIVDIPKPYWIDIRVDAPALLFTTAISVLAAVLAGTVPALRASRGDVGNLLRDESRGSSSLRLGRFSAGLVVVELALSCALLVAAGFMIRSVVAANTVDPGLDPDNVMTARFGLFEEEYPDQEARDLFFFRLLDRLREEPGIVSAALAQPLPAGGRTGAVISPVAVEGASYDTDAAYPLANVAYVTDGYFRTLGIEVLQGRELLPSEWRPDGQPVALVDRSFAERHFPGVDPIGRSVRIGRSDSEAPWLRIVGVVPDVRVSSGVGGIGDEQLPSEGIYTGVARTDPRFLSILMRTQGPPGPMGGRAREIVTELDPNLPLYWVFTMDEVIDEGTWAFNIFGSTFTIFGGAALFLAAVGLFGVMSFSVAQRRQEMGVRMALGADSGAIYSLVFRRVLLQLGLGIGLGLVLGVLLSLPLQAVMFGVDATDPGVYVAILVTLVATGCLATFFPARRATRVDPITALRPD